MFIPVYQPDLNGNEKKYVNDCLDSTWISSKGKYIEMFEQRFASYTGSSYATSVCNGTVAIHLALAALGIGEGDEVIVPTLTYIASVNPIVQVGAKPVFADSLPDTWQLDPADIEKKITDKTKAIMVVHLYGQVAEMDTVMKLAADNGLLVIEDSAEAFGSLYKGQHVGTFGDIGTFSFFGNKTITCGEGGMVTAKDEAVYEKLKHLKNQGVSSTKQYWHDVLAYNYRMTNIQAAIGLSQLERADEFISRKRQIAELYKSNITCGRVKVHPEAENTLHSYWMTSMLVDDSADREPLREHLKSKGVETRPLFYPVHTMPMYVTDGKFPVADDLSSRGMNLPSWPGLTDGQVKDICGIIDSYYS